MPTETIILSGLLPATPQRVYDAWLDAKGHTAMTGSKATVESKEIGGRFTAWAGYIEGTHVALEPGRRILQSWRATDFPPDAPESYLEVKLEPEAGGTRITFRHTEVPAKQAPGYLKGWRDYYLKPMARYFGGAAEPRKAAGKGSAKPAAKKTAVKKTAAKKASARATPKRAAAKKGVTRKPAARKVAKPGARRSGKR
jgi:uncharacterized protein YndB with AHSA1/START domain